MLIFHIHSPVNGYLVLFFFSATNNAAMNFLEINLCRSFSRPIVSMLFSHCNPSNKYILLYNSVHLYDTDGLLFIHFHGVELLLESRSYLEVYFSGLLWWSNG